MAVALALFVGLQWGPPLDGGGQDKWGHALLYFGVAWLAWDLLPKADRLARAGALAAMGLLAGALMEAGQAGIPGRTPDPMDLMADLGGALAAGLARAWSEGRSPRGAQGAGAAEGRDVDAAAAQDEVGAEAGGGQDGDLGEAGADTPRR